MDSSTAAKVAELKRAIGSIARAPASRAQPCIGAIDELLGGGFPRGRVAELAGARSSGKVTLALQAAARATAAASLVAWIDAPRELYPPAAAALGVELARLLIVRPSPGKSLVTAAARAAEIVAQSRAFVLIVLDLGRARLEGTVAARVRQAAHDSEAAVVLVSSGAGSSIATLRLEVTPRQAILVRGGAAPPGTRATLPWIGTREFRSAERQAALLAAAPRDFLRDGGHTGGAELPPFRGPRPPKAEAVRNVLIAEPEVRR